MNGMVLPNPPGADLPIRRKTLAHSMYRIVKCHVGDHTRIRALLGHRCANYIYTTVVVFWQRDVITRAELLSSLIRTQEEDRREQSYRYVLSYNDYIGSIDSALARMCAVGLLTHA